jgi:hypothetical protein
VLQEGNLKYSLEFLAVAYKNTCRDNPPVFQQQHNQHNQDEQPVERPTELFDQMGETTTMRRRYMEFSSICKRSRQLFPVAL